VNAECVDFVHPVLVEEFCAGWLIVVSFGIGQQAFLCFLDHLLTLPTKISFACFAHLSFLSIESAWFHLVFCTLSKGIHLQLGITGADPKAGENAVVFTF